MSKVNEIIKMMESKKKEIKDLENILSEISMSRHYTLEYKKAVEENKLSQNSHLWYKMSIFAYLFRLFGVIKYLGNSGGHLTNYVEYNYKGEMMSEIEDIVIKYRDKMKNELNIIVEKIEGE